MDIHQTSHRRYNILTGEWVLVSPHRAERPWQGRKEKSPELKDFDYDPGCYLCPTNQRAGDFVTPNYKGVFVFENDFPAILKNEAKDTEKGFLKAQRETGICKVICFSENHWHTLPIMPLQAIENVIEVWQKEYKTLGSQTQINYVQIFENKGAMMGCSNPHPHGQIWAHESIPDQIIRKTTEQKKYWNVHKKSLLGAYLEQELKEQERVLIENDFFVTLIPYWAVWPYETMIVPKKHWKNIAALGEKHIKSFADILKKTTTMYDNLFEVSFPYSAGIHQAPTSNENHDFWHFHMSFYPPLLRSASVKKFMVGYEMFATPQRDITPEQAAQTLKALSKTHYLSQ